MRFALCKEQPSASRKGDRRPHFNNENSQAGACHICDYDEGLLQVEAKAKIYDFFLDIYYLANYIMNYIDPEK